jgi:hypothetical protein
VLVAGFEQEAFVVRLGGVVHMELGPEVTVWYSGALVLATIVIFNIEIVNVHNVLPLCGAGVVPSQALRNGGFLRARLTLITWLDDITAFEEEALHVVVGLVSNSVLGEVVAGGDGFALMLTGDPVCDIKEVDVHHIVQSDCAGSIDEGAEGIHRVQSVRSHQSHGQVHSQGTQE